MSIKLMSQVWELELDQSQKFVLMALCDYANDDGVCFPKMDQLAWKTDFTERGARKIVRQLTSSDLIEIVEMGGGRGKSTIYRVMPWKGIKKPGLNPERRSPFRDKKPGTTFPLSRQETRNHRSENPEQPARETRNSRRARQVKNRHIEPSLTIKEKVASQKENDNGSKIYGLQSIREIIERAGLSR